MTQELLTESKRSSLTDSDSARGGVSRLGFWASLSLVMPKKREALTALGILLGLPGVAGSGPRLFFCSHAFWYGVAWVPPPVAMAYFGINHDFAVPDHAFRRRLGTSGI